MKKIIKISICILLCLAFGFIGTACNYSGENRSLTPPSNSGYWKEEHSVMDSDDWNDDYTPNITITEIGGSSNNKDDELDDEVNSGTITTIEALVNSAVVKSLQEVGFTCQLGVALNVNQQDFATLGIYYYDDELAMYDDDTLVGVGFVEIVNQKDNYTSLAESDDLFVVMDVDDDTDDTIKIVTYSYENILPYHFVYQNKYVSYYQQTPTEIVYTVLANERENYDLSYGSLYDFDNDRYIYDETVMGEYKTHDAVELFGQDDYDKLEKELQDISDAQLINGYVVNEFNIVYISPESIQTYLASEEEDTFFGYSVNELTETLGFGTALRYTQDGFVEATILEPTAASYNWKSFLIKMGIGCGIILVGAILTPLTGGASFGCALLTISEVAINYAITAAVGTLVIETVSGLISGKSIQQSIKDASYKGLDAFANGFMIGAVVGSVGVLTGVIKPKACFVAGTPVAIAYDSFRSIESISVGDYVLSYNEDTGLVSPQRVTQVFQKQTYSTLKIRFDDSVVETTHNHPFYSLSEGGWVEAGNLRKGDVVLDAYGNAVCVKFTQTVHHSTAVTVYNFTVENNHTYFVGDDAVLVHNECTTLNGKRNKAVSDAWKAERNAVIDGTSKYDWTPAQKAELIANGKIKGYEGAHMIDVRELVGTANERLISDPNNIIFLTHEQHLAVHSGCYRNATSIDKIVKFVPWAAERLALLGI